MRVQIWRSALGSAVGTWLLSSALHVGALRAEPGRAAPAVVRSAEKPHTPTASRAPGEWMRAVERTRALPFLRPVELVRLGEPQWQSRLLLELHGALPEHRQRGLSSLLTDLGMMPLGTDLFELSRRASSAALRAVYSPSTRTYYVAPDVPQDQLHAVSLHELTHALHDQHFDLLRRLDPRAWPSDAVAAAHALAEGDAVITASLASTGEDLTWLDAHPEEPPPRHSGLPDIITRSASSPYADGAVFVRRLYEEGGWTAVDAAWRRPTLSTEQVLHAEKYNTNEGWRHLPEWRPQGRSCRRQLSDVIGEQALRDMLQHWTDRASAAEAAAGWDGDRLDVWTCEGENPWRLQIAFDTPDDFNQALPLLRAAAGSRASTHADTAQRLVCVSSGSSDEGGCGSTAHP